nr:hypothetical transcript [Hymenolepis microstoma]
MSRSKQEFIEISVYQKTKPVDSQVTEPIVTSRKKDIERNENPQENSANLLQRRTERRDQEMAGPTCKERKPASSGGMDAEVSKYPEFSGFESPCLVTSLQLSTEGSAEVVVRPNKDDFSYWSFISGWS